VRDFTDGGSPRAAEAGTVETILIIAAVILLAPMIALWIDDERDHMHPKAR
jgi:hypothetical protein